MKLVLNTSPVIFLGKINCLHLLIDSVNTVFIPQVVLDDLLARRKAKRLGLQVMGTIGILLFWEKWKKLNTNQAWEKIMELTEQHSMYLSPHILEYLKGQLQ